MHFLIPHMSLVSFVCANVLGRKIVSAQVTLQNAAYVSSANLFARVKGNLGGLAAKEINALEQNFAHLDVAAHTTGNPQAGYLGALWNATPSVEAVTLSNPYV